MTRLNILFLVVLLFSCKASKEDTVLPSSQIIQLVDRIETDKSKYNPGDNVLIKVHLKHRFTGVVRIKCKFVITLLEEDVLNVNGTSFEFNWIPPINDFKGYLIEFIFEEEGLTKSYASTAIDVSSDWTRFPRYGFLSDFSNSISQNSIISNLDFLKNFHINGLQFYDWHHKHHLPLKMNGNNPSTVWLDIAKRNISFNTVEKYIHESKKRNIASMSYNLLYGAWEDYASDGVHMEWLLFKDQNQQNIDKHELDDNWALSDILVMNPANDDWQQYIFLKTANVYYFLDFDGWHLDQLGDRGTVFDYDGKPLSLEKSFTPFLQNLRSYFPDKKMVLNAVNQYGQEEVLQSPVDFTYTEVWNPFETYVDLANIIMENRNASNSQQNTVLAAYLNYDLADHSGQFNAPAVLMADAVIMAFGGAHLELGEHMLGKEYFPNNNLKMSGNLIHDLIEYYDFMVAYQNILRDDFTLGLSTGITSEEVFITDWLVSRFNIATIKNSKDKLTVFQLINFNGINSTKWRDNSGTQTAPVIQTNFIINIPVAEVNQVVYSSPDWHDGVQKKLEYTFENGICTVTIPYLEYWGMLIIE